MANKVFGQVVTGIVDQELDWFFKKVLNDQYNRRRQTLGETDKETQPIPAIDYVLQTCIGPDTKYPPQSASQWHEYFTKLSSGYSRVFQRMLVVYLKLDISSYLVLRERESTTGRQTRAKDKAELSALETKLNNLMTIPLSFDISNSVVQLSTGLWALDNEQTNLMISCLSDPSINLANFFESPKELIKLIIGNLYITSNPRMALYMSKIHRYEGWDDEYDSMYAYLLISSGQLTEALKYERLFIDQENYGDILNDFFELCSKCDVTKSLNRLNLSVEEEEALNHHLVYDSSRPITPSSLHSHDLSHQHHQPSPHQVPHHHQYHRQAGNTSAHNVSLSSNKSRSSGHKPRNRSIQVVQRVPSFNDSPARNTRSARKKKTTK